MQKRKLAVYLMAGTMLATSMPVTAYAEPAAGTQEIESTSLVDDKTSATVPVEYTVGANFNVKFPSAIELTKGDSGYAYSGTVGVKGDIDSGKSVKVKPDSSITMYDVTNRPTEDVPSGAEDQAYDHKDAKNATVAQTKQQWGMTELSADTYSDTDLTLTAGAMQSGKWKGLINVNISYGEYIEEPVTKTAGLYDAEGNLLCNWEDSGIDVGTDYTSSTYKTATTSGYYVLTNTYPTATEVVIPDGVTSIGEYSFFGCTNLTNITFPNSVTTIKQEAFDGCSNLTNVKIPESVTSIGDWAFQGTNITNIKIPSNTTSLGKGVFYDCNNLTSIDVDENNTSYCSDDGILYNKEKSSIIVYPLGKNDSSITIPDSITKIENYAFSNCSNLTSITIPENVTNIGRLAFKNCTGEVIINCNIPDGPQHDQGVFIGSKFTKATIGKNVTNIGDYAFGSVTSLTSITILGNVTNIGREAFYNTPNLTSLMLPDSVTSIGFGAFMSCTNLTSITIPNGVTKMENGLFNCCKNLSSVTIPDSVTSIGHGEFAQCSNLTSITYEGTQEQWNAITKNPDWNEYSYITTIHCTDGDVTL